MSRARMAALAFATFAVAACTTTPVQLGDPLPPGLAVSGGRMLQSNACGFEPILLPVPLSTYDRYRRAYQELKRQARSDLITDVAIRESASGFIFGVTYCTQLQARAIKRPAPKAAPPGAAGPGGT